MDIVEDVVLAILVYLLNAYQTQASLDFSKVQHDQDQQTQLDKDREELFETYLDRMSDLIITDNLHSSHYGDEVQMIAQARTLTVVHMLDPERKGNIIRFLYEAGLITAVKNGYAIIRLNKADLMSVSLVNAFLNRVDLHDSIMIHADFRSAILTNANLSISNLSYADLRASDLRNIDPHGSSLYKANLKGANIQGVDLTGVIVKGATMPDGSIHP